MPTNPSPQPATPDGETFGFNLDARPDSGPAKRFDKLIVWLIFLVLAILVVEVMCSDVVGVDEHGEDIVVSSLSDEVHIGLAIVDTLACFVFLLEFFVKLRMVTGRRSWFLRHFLIDLVPSVPVGLIA